MRAPLKFACSRKLNRTALNSLFRTTAPVSTRRALEAPTVATGLETCSAEPRPCTQASACRPCLEEGRRYGSTCRFQENSSRHRDINRKLRPTEAYAVPTQARV